MFESAIINKLATDSTLTALLSTYGSSTAIFSDEAPEDAILPYIVTSIDGNDINTSGTMQAFNMYIDIYFPFGSRKNARIAGQQVEYGLDQQRLTHARYIDLWVHLFSGPTMIQDNDSRTIDVNLQFTVYANRSQWMQTTKN